MKVKTLIEALKKYDPEARVCFGSFNGEGKDEILNCYCYTLHPEKVILKTADQFDVAEEIKELCNYFIETNTDEIDGYSEMIDIGYTPDVVEKYCGKEMADDMRNYCDTHGIEY